MSDPNEKAGGNPEPGGQPAPSPEPPPTSPPADSPTPPKATGTRPSATGAAARRTAPVKKMSAKEKKIRLLLIFSTPVLCLILIGLIALKIFGGPKGPKRISLNAAQLWNKHLDKAREGQTKVSECFFLVQQNNGAVPPDAKAKFDESLGAGRKILEDTLAEMLKLRQDAGEGVMEYDRDLYPLQKDLMLARRLADETDRQLTVEYPKRYKAVLDAVAKVQKEYTDSRDAMTPEKQKAVTASVESVCKQAQDLAEQWTTLLDKYVVENKTSERNDLEEEAINKLNAAIMTTRKLLKDLK